MEIKRNSYMEKVRESVLTKINSVSEETLKTTLTEIFDELLNHVDKDLSRVKESVKSGVQTIQKELINCCDDFIIFNGFAEIDEKIPSGFNQICKFDECSATINKLSEDSYKITKNGSKNKEIRIPLLCPYQYENTDLSKIENEIIKKISFQNKKIRFSIHKSTLLKDSIEDLKKVFRINRLPFSIPYMPYLENIYYLVLDLGENDEVVVEFKMPIKPVKPFWNLSDTISLQTPRSRVLKKGSEEFYEYDVNHQENVDILFMEDFNEVHRNPEKTTVKVTKDENRNYDFRHFFKTNEAIIDNIENKTLRKTIVSNQLKKDSFFPSGFIRTRSDIQCFFNSFEYISGITFVNVETNDNLCSEREECSYGLNEDLIIKRKSTLYLVVKIEKDAEYVNEKLSYIRARIEEKLPQYWCVFKPEKNCKK
jgi:hypothetical protein